jgi:formiminotetrahydrofolate cyclodeaminase
MQAKKQTIEAWCDALSSKAPVPGGGGVAAMLGALAACLASMVGHLTEGKKGYESFDEQCAQLNGQALQLANRLLGLIDADAAAFKALMDTWKKGSGDEDYIAACGPSVQTVSEVSSVLDLLESLEKYGNRNVQSDVGIGAACALAALSSARINILVNVQFMSSEEKRASLAPLLEDDIPEESQRARAIISRVEKELAGDERS